MYNKRKFNKINDKKVLHKVKKQWVTISLALLMMIGGGAVASHIVHASTATNSPVTQVTSTQNIQNNANNLHKTLLTNAANSNKTTNNKPSMGNSITTNNKKSSSSASVTKSSASNNLMSFNSADFDWKSNLSDLSDTNSDIQFSNNSLTSLTNEATSYNNEFNSVSNSVSDIVDNINESASDIDQSISDKLSDAKISSSQAKSMSQSVSASASSAEASEQKISSSVESEYNSASNARNNVYVSLCKSLASSKYSNYLNLVNDHHVNPTFKDALIISSGTNYSPVEQQYIKNIHNKLSDLNKQSDQLSDLLTKDGINNSDGNNDFIMNHPDAMQAHRHLEVEWVNFYRKMYNLPLVNESSELDNVAQQYAERGSDPDCLTFGFVNPQEDIRGFYTDSDNADNNGLAGHRTGVLNYETDVGIGANNGENNHNDDTLLGGDYAGTYVGLKGYDYLKPYRNGEIGMNYAISYPKPGLFPYSDAKDAQQWSLWVPTLHSFSSDANSINNQYMPVNSNLMYSDFTYFGNDTKVTVHDDTINQNVNVSNITRASDFGDADYICYAVDNNAIQLNHIYTITVSNIHNWQPHTFKYTTKLYDPNMSFSNSNNGSNSNQSSSNADNTTSASSQSNNQSYVINQNSNSSVAPSFNNNTSVSSQSNNQNSAASQNNDGSSSVASSSAQQPSNGTIPSFNTPTMSSTPVKPSNATSAVTPMQSNATSMSDNSNSLVVSSAKPQTTDINTNSQVSDSTTKPSGSEKHYVSRNHHAKRGSIYLFNTDFKGLSKRNRSVVTIKGVRAYRRTRKGHYIPVMDIKPNTELTVKCVVKFGKITKLQLTNGLLVTSNKHLVAVNKIAKNTSKHNAKRAIKGINIIRYNRALRKSNYVLHHGRYHTTHYIYHMAKKFNKANNAEKEAYRKFVHKHTSRSHKAFNKALTNLNKLVNALK